MTARPAAARVAPVRAGAVARGASRPAGRSGSAPRGAGGAKAGPTSSSAFSSSARGRGGAAGRGGGTGGGGRGGGGRRRGGAGPDEPDEPRQITLRTAGFALVLLVAFIVLAPTLRAYVAQQEQLRDVNASLAETSARAEALQQELLRWDDPEYVKSQAADRFGLVAPGETAYRVVDPETIIGEDPIGDLTAQEQAASPYASTATLPWYAQVWDSVEVAGTAQRATEEPVEAPDGEPSDDVPVTAPEEAGAPADGADGADG